MAKKEFKASWSKAQITVETEGLTDKEVDVLIAARNNEFNDCLTDDYTWCFAIINNSGMISSVARGVISSLIKKGYCGVSNEKKVDDRTFWLTEEGRKLFSDYSKEIPEVPNNKEEAPKKKASKKSTPATKKVTLKAFTGMVIGEFTAEFQHTDPFTWKVTTKKDKALIFDADGKQVGAKNPKFANTITF
jgi:hypothetical protein